MHFQNSIEVHLNSLSYPTNRQTDKQKNGGENSTLQKMAEIITAYVPSHLFPEVFFQKRLLPSVL